MVSRRIRTTGTLCGAFGLFMLGPTIPAYAVNLLANPGFEAGTDNAQVNQTASGWTFVPTGISEARRASFFNNTPGGMWSIWARTFQDVTDHGVTQVVSGITPGANYDLTSQLYFEPNFNMTGSTVKVRLTWLDAGNSPVGTPIETQILSSSNPATEVWTPFNAMGTAPVGASKIQVFLGWEFGTLGVSNAGAFFDDVVLDGPGSPPLNSTWDIDASGTWHDIGHWANGVIPNAIGANAEFFDKITAPRTVVADTPVVVGSMAFDNANTYVLAGASNLTMDVDGGTAAISVLQGTHKINLPMTLNDSTNVTVASGATLQIADPLNLNGRTMTKAGDGVLSIISTVTGGSAPAILSTTGGTTQVDFGIGTPATGSTAAVANVTVNVTTNAAKVAFGANQTLARLDAVTPLAGDQEIDLAGNVVRVYATNRATEEGLIYADIQAARNSASGRDGVYDSTSPGGSAWSVGVTDQATDAHGDLSVLVRLTRTGDANVDGTVNLTDFNLLASNFGLTGRRWDNADFNYDGTTNLTDFNLLASNFGLSAGPEGPTAQDWAALAAAVPEPGSLALLGVAALAAMSRRRRAS